MGKKKKGEIPQACFLFDFFNARKRKVYSWALKNGVPKCVFLLSRSVKCVSKFHASVCEKNR